jgi:uncharacterized protein
MTSPIFIDTNVPIYAVGRPHPLKGPCTEVLRLVGQRPRAFITDAEVLQELIHRYLALRIWPQGRAVVRDFGMLMSGRIEPLFDTDILAAAGLADRDSGLSGRDLVHLAVMARVGSAAVISADRDFDRAGDIRRFDPLDVAGWRAELDG